MIKSILFDADGVTVQDSGGRFSARLVEEFNADQDVVDEFFLNVFPQCSIAKADLKEKLVAAHQSLGFSSVQKMIEVWFETASADTEMLAYIQQIRHSSGIMCFLATDNERYRTQHIENLLDVGENFDGVYASCTVGHVKSDPHFYQKVFADLNLRPDEILLVDDSEKNCACATESGLNAHHFTSIKCLEEHLDANPMFER